ncbi:MAG: aminoglycoside phosphotransferase family protein [Oscillospiraceae bacterium]|nr:aminoglycoside phosphotransferase family protein [Oscillospiraceae bacterium]
MVGLCVCHRLKRDKGGIELQIERAAYAFQMEGNPVSCEELTQGHINKTLKITTDAGKEYVLQMINKYVFRNPIRLMGNISAVTEYLRQRVEDKRQAQHFILTYKGTYYHRDRNGEFWRMSDYVGGFALDTPETPEDFYQSALAFGRFQQLLSNFPAEALYETIPEFHNTIDRYRQFRASLELDPCDRVAQAKAEIAYLLKQEKIAGTLQLMRESGELPLRVTHNDTKLNNVLLDKETRKALCVLDLDTVMPGLSVHDFGDAIRYGAATAAEDETDVDKMELDLDLFRVYTEGYLEAAPSLTDKEVEMLPMGALIMTLEVAVRFLKDFVDGDLYFKTSYPEHNLIRARTQIKLAMDMQAKWDDMNRIVAETAAKMRKQ